MSNNIECYIEQLTSTINSYANEVNNLKCELTAFRNTYLNSNTNNYGYNSYNNCCSPNECTKLRCENCKLKALISCQDNQIKALNEKNIQFENLLSNKEFEIKDIINNQQKQIENELNLQKQKLNEEFRIKFTKTKIK